MADDTHRDSEDESPPPEEKGWVRIQKNTFTNWANEKLRTVDIQVEDITSEFSNGIKLINLVEVLQGRSLGEYIKNPINHQQCIVNITQGLEALQTDGIHVGAEEIKAGKMKLILGFIWHLIKKYHIGGTTEIPTKNLMLAWTNAVLEPHLEIKNFSSDWNDGLALFGILNYCSGEFPKWWERSGSSGMENCREAIAYANSKYGIPLLVTAEDFSSSDLDELSGMTYLSYFMIKDSCGYKATLQWTNSILQEKVFNFTTDWNNGYALADLSTHLGGNVPGFPFQHSDDTDSVENLKLGVASSRTLGVEPVVSAEEMSKPTVNHIAIMAYAARHRKARKEAEPQPEPKQHVLVTA